MIRGLAVALVAAALYALLGIAVSHVPPHGIDVAGRALAGQAPRLALTFTESCWWEFLVALAVVAIAVGIRYPAWRARVLFAIPTTLIAWQLSDVLKNVFKRPRPDYWTLIHEPTYSYSSGHAMFALLVYGLWAWFIWNSALPHRARAVAAPLLALWACGIVWSRLALGAHYVTDLIGGLLLATTALALASAVAASLRLRLRGVSRTGA
ncbi:MAG TPA: phosphatase PAP2 family protein [Candidatus Elarobacter sp.]|nr:phosphatase PAP2 family protein [Dongiaceae bacterium]HZW53065.1 phosphatase PAP2 family protein [Candidatus Elarobacter sp.]